MKVLGASTHVRGRQFGVGPADHGAVRAAADVLELGVDTEFAVRLDARGDERHLGLDAGSGVDADQVVIDFDRAAVPLRAESGELVHALGHLV